ncbi:putative N-acyl homoserine lactonase AttM, partial [Mytilinidion resinicola]
PNLQTPSSSSTVKVSVIDTNTRISLPFGLFLTPVFKGKDRLSAPSYSTLIEHPSGRKLLFDLGVRKDWENLAPFILAMNQQIGATIAAGKNVSDVLSENGINPSEIESVIWSHWHWDHIGDITTFPSTTSLLVGPGLTSSPIMPGYPSNPESPIRETDYTGRTMAEVPFDTPLKIGPFAAYDFFGDGSFYLLSSPGHAIGHMCALARTTSSSFVLLGGDCCHEPGEFRPTPYLPLPESFQPSPLTPHEPHSVCPGSLFQALHPSKSATEPFFDVLEGVHEDLKLTRESIRGLEAFDASDDILVVIAHDDTLAGIMDVFP